MLAKTPKFLPLTGKGSIWLGREDSTNINFMGEVMSPEGDLCSIGVGLPLASGRNSIAMHCHCITVNEAGKQGVCTV